MITFWVNSKIPSRGGSDHKSNYQSKVYAHWQSSYRLTKCWKDVSISSMVLMKMMCEKKKRLYTWPLNPKPWPPPWPRSSLTPLPQTLSLAVGCVRWFPPSAGSHHFTPTWSLCGPENRPNPLGPRWHQVTHIVRFATHPAQKSISEQMSLLKMEHPSSTKVQFDCNYNVKLQMFLLLESLFR